MLPDEFKARRMALGLSQRELSRLWGMGANGDRTIRRWEDGSNPIGGITAFALCAMEKLKAAGLRIESDYRPLEGQKHAAE